MTRTQPNPPIHVSPSASLEGLSTLRSAGGEEIGIVVHDVGSGSPCVFLHGLAGLNDHWEDVVHRVSPNLRCICLELPLLRLRGDDCSIHGVTDLTIRFLEQHVAEPATLVGNSFGGHVALRVAIERPDLVRGLVLAGSSGLFERTMVSEIQTRPSREWLSRKIGELFYDKAMVREADIDRAYRDLTDRRCARAMVKLSWSARRNHLGDHIARIKAPTLIIWGREDVVTPPEAANELAAKIRGSRLVWFDRCGHAPMIEHPDDFSREFLAFARELDERDRRAAPHR